MTANPIDSELLELMACPACDDRPAVRQEGDNIVCDQCGRVYPIRDGIPEMLVGSASLSKARENHDQSLRTARAES